MTDVLEGTSLSSGVQDQGTNPEPVESHSAPAEKPVNEGRVFRQPEVDSIVKRAKHEAVERYRRLQVEQPEYVRQKYGDAAPQSLPSQQPAAQSNTAASLSVDDIRRMAAEESQRSWNELREREQRSALEQDAQRIASEFLGKLSAGRERYPDFDAVTGDVQFGEFPNVVQLATVFADNTADVMYELSKDLIKMNNLENLAMRSPKAAQLQMQRFAQSIKENAEASKLYHAKEPLSQLRPSNAGISAGDRQEVRDLRRKYIV